MWLGRLSPSESIAWAAFVMLSIASFVWAMRRPGSLLRKNWPLVVVVGGIPATCLAIAVISFAVMRSHPLVQFAGSHGADGWSLWTGLWPILLLACLGGFVASLVLAGVHSKQGRVSTVWGLTALANLLSLLNVFANFPSA